MFRLWEAKVGESRSWESRILKWTIEILVQNYAKHKADQTDSGKFSKNKLK